MAWRKVWKQGRNGNRKNVWVLRWYDDAGRMRAKTFHDSGKEADEACRRLEHELNEGTLGRRRRIRWLDFCEEYLDDLASNRRPRTVEDYRKTLGHLTDDFRPEWLDQVTARLLRQFVRQRTEGRSPASRNKLVRTLRAIFSWAVPEYLRENPARQVRFAEQPERDKRILSLDELVQVLEVADLRGRAVILFGVCCGLRREEIAALRWSDVDTETARVWVRNSEWHTTKSGRQRVVLMPPALVKVLAAMKSAWESQFVFPEVYASYRGLPNPVKHAWSNAYQKARRSGHSREVARQSAWESVKGHQQPRRPISPDRLTDLVPRLVKRAGLPYATLHDLRRSFCTYLAACGTDPLAAQKLAGHSAPAVTARHYVEIVPETLKAQEQLPFWRVVCPEDQPEREDAA